MWSNRNRNLKIKIQLYKHINWLSSIFDFFSKYFAYLNFHLISKNNGGNSRVCTGKPLIDVISHINFSVYSNCIELQVNGISSVWCKFCFYSHFYFLSSRYLLIKPSRRTMLYSSNFSPSLVYDCNVYIKNWKFSVRCFHWLNIDTLNAIVK